MTLKVAPHGGLRVSVQFNLRGCIKTATTRRGLAPPYFVRPAVQLRITVMGGAEAAVRTALIVMNRPSGATS